MRFTQGLVSIQLRYDHTSVIGQPNVRVVKGMRLPRAMGSVARRGRELGHDHPARIACVGGDRGPFHAAGSEGGSARYFVLRRGSAIHGSTAVFQVA